MEGSVRSINELSFSTNSSINMAAGKSSFCEMSREILKVERWVDFGGKIMNQEGLDYIDPTRGFIRKAERLILNPNWIS